MYWAIFSSHPFLSLLNLIHFHVSNYHLLQMTPKVNLSTDLAELQTHKYNNLLDIAKWIYLKIPQIHSLNSPTQVCFSFCVLYVGEWHQHLPSYTGQTPRDHPWHIIILTPSSLFIHFLPKVYLKHIHSVLRDQLSSSATMASCSCPATVVTSLLVSQYLLFQSLN